MEIVNERLRSSVAQLDLSGDLNRAVARLLLEKKRRDLTKYELMRQHFTNKYGVDFQSFKKQVAGKDIEYEKEQNLFDWDMATTAIEDLREEIAYLEGLIK